MKRFILLAVVAVMLAASVAFAACGPVWVCDDKGVCQNLWVCS
jgi:opacity protein-like surface antigen